MKSTVSCSKLDDEFPKLMSHNDGTVVMFTESGVGMCVHAAGDTEMGEYGRFWDMCQFNDFSGEVTLSNGG